MQTLSTREEILAEMKAARIEAPPASMSDKEMKELLASGKFAGEVLTPFMAKTYRII
jgi:hypothetical protein